MDVRRLKEKDAGAIAYIVAHLIDSSDKRNTLPPSGHLKTLLADDRTYLVAAFSNGLPIGYTLAYRFPSLYAAEQLAYLYDIEVVEAHRRNGIGRLLIETVLACLKADGVTEVWLGTAVDNAAGQALFTATGAEKSGETFNDYTYDLA